MPGLGLDQLGLGLGRSRPEAATPPLTFESIFGAALAVLLDSRFLTQAAGTASAMLDQSGNGNNCTTGAGPQPAVGTGVNGIQKLILSGIESFSSTTRPVAAGVARTVFCVGTPNFSNKINAAFTNGLAAPYATFLAGKITSTSYIYSDGVSTNITDTTEANPTSGGPHLYIWKYDFSPTPSFARILDGTAGTPNTVPTASDTGTAGYQAWGNATAGQQWIGDGYVLGEVLGFSTPTQDAELRTLVQSIWSTP